MLQYFAIMLNYAQVWWESYYAQNYAGIMCQGACSLSTSVSLNKTAEAFSKVNSMLFNHLSNYHYLLTMYGMT